MLVAAEASGDALGAELARALRDRLGASLRLVGVGGARMAGEDVAAPIDTSALSLVGLFGALAAYPKVLKRVRQTVALARRERPDLAVLIDAWGFTLRVAQGLRRADPGITLVKYVGPQVWATRPGRARTLARVVDQLLSIHTFDAPFFEREGLPVTFVGNPVLARDFTASDPEALRSALGVGPGEPLLLMMPGSRPQEIRRLCPPFGAAAAILARTRPELRFLVAAAETVAEQVKAQVGRWTVAATVIEGEALRLSAMRAASVALVCSGTATTELALAGCPMVVAYRLDPLSAPIVRRLLRTPYITLVNVAAGSFVAPELVQERCSGPDLAREVTALLDDPAARAGQIAAQAAALDIMRGGVDDPAAAAAEAVIAALRAKGLVQPRDSIGG